MHPHLMTLLLQLQLVHSFPSLAHTHADTMSLSLASSKLEDRYSTFCYFILSCPILCAKPNPSVMSQKEPTTPNPICGRHLTPPFRGHLVVFLVLFVLSSSKTHLSVLAVGGCKQRAKNKLSVSVVLRAF